MWGLLMRTIERRRVLMRRQLMGLSTDELVPDPIAVVAGAIHLRVVKVAQTTTKA
jgi:hypothetical protein